ARRRTVRRRGRRRSPLRRRSRAGSDSLTRFSPSSARSSPGRRPRRGTNARSGTPSRAWACTKPGPEKPTPTDRRPTVAERVTDEQVYDALLAFRVEQTDKTKDAAGRYLAVLAIHGEPTPDDPLWQPMRVALRVALREAEADLSHERARVERDIAAFRGLSSQYVAMQAERDALARRIDAVQDALDNWQAEGHSALIRRIRRALDE